jgi:hypothetical protein
MQPHIRYDPRKLPVVITTEKECTHKPSRTQSVPSSLHGASASFLPDVSLV